MDVDILNISVINSRSFERMQPFYPHWSRRRWKCLFPSSFLRKVRYQ